MPTLLFFSISFAIAQEKTKIYEKGIPVSYTEKTEYLSQAAIATSYKDVEEKITNESSGIDLENSIGISIPVIWNYSRALYYALGSPKYSNGRAVSYGLVLQYSRNIYKNIFGIIGVGYYNQCFGIERPFYYSSPLEPIFRTEAYNYNNIILQGGIGYKKRVYENSNLQIAAVYNHFSSYQQKYVLSKKNHTSQVNNKKIFIGSVADLRLGFEKSISHNVSAGINLNIPFYMEWKNDTMFYKYDYSNDTQQIAKNKFSVGAIISCNYHF